MFKNPWIKFVIISTAVFCVVLLGTVIYYAGDRGSTPGPHDDQAQEGEGPGDAASGHPEQGEQVSSDDSNLQAEADDAKTEAEEAAVEETVAALPEYFVVELFFADSVSVAGGRPGEYGYVKPVRRTLPFEPGVLRLAMQELICGPLPGDGDVSRTVPETVRLLDIEVKDGVAIINLSDHVLKDSPGGSLSGLVFMESVVYTATQFPTVDSVVVLVLGHPWDDGHDIWDRPIGRADLAHALFR